MLLYILKKIDRSAKPIDMQCTPVPTHPQNSSTLSNVMTRLISSIHPRAAATPGVCGKGVGGVAVIGV